MNLILDTHILIWALNDDPKLPERARELILDPDNLIYYSAVSVWEIAIKHSIRPDNVAFTGGEFAAFCREAGFLPLEIKDYHAVSLETLSRKENAAPHNDPFDRMLIAQAKAERMTLVTHDALIPTYDENCILPV